MELQTFDRDYPVHINGAPRAFNGKVIIGYASTTGATRGYVTTYDADTGKELWRFYTVPGNPAHGFENKAMEMAAKTWAGEWWKFGGGANVWNAIAYDSDADTVFIGTGSGYPWNRRVRSADEGDNLFVASIIALALRSRQRCWWRVQVWDGDGEASNASESSWWEMGLLSPHDWTAQWLVVDDAVAKTDRETPCRGLHGAAMEICR